MPQGWIDELDSPPQFEALGDFTGGQVSNAKARLLAPNQWSLLQNLEIAITGQGSTRFGTVYMGATTSNNKVLALAYLNASTAQEELAWMDIGGGSGTVYKWNGSAWVSAAVSLQSLTISGIPSIIQGGNLAYLSTGVGMLKWDGTASAATLISGDGTGTNEPGPQNANIIVWHNNRLVAAGANIKSYSTDPAPFPDAIYFSNILDATKWGSPKGAQQIRVGAGDGQAVTALVPWTQLNLAVFKRHSVWVVNADPSLSVANFPIQLVHGTVGCAAQRTAVQVGQDIMFLSDDGVRSLQATFASDSREELSIPLSYPVQDWINRINWGSVQNACAIFWRNLYIIALPLDSQTANSHVLVYNTITKSWAGYWSNLAINCFAIRLVSSVPHLFAGFSNADRVIEFNDYVLPANWTNSTFQDYDGTQVQPRATSKAVMLQDPQAQKVGIGGEIEWNNSDGTLQVSPILDENTKSPVTVAGSTSINVSSGGFTIPFTVPLAIGTSGLGRAAFDLMQYGEFRELQYDILGLTGGRKEIRQVSTAAILRPCLVGRS